MQGFPAEFAMYLNYCRGLRFDEGPDYMYLRQLFRILFRTLNHQYDYTFDWTLLKQKAAASASSSSTIPANHGLPPAGTGFILNCTGWGMTVWALNNAHYLWHGLGQPPTEEKEEERREKRATGGRRKWYKSKPPVLFTKVSNSLYFFFFSPYHDSCLTTFSLAFLCSFFFLYCPCVTI